MSGTSGNPLPRLRTLHGAGRVGAGLLLLLVLGWASTRAAASGPRAPFSQGSGPTPEAAPTETAPTTLVPFKDAVAIVAGWGHTCVLTREGGVQCWGLNPDGRLGDGTTETRYTPVDVIGLGSGVSALAAGTEHTCAVVAGGVQCWGHNYNGQLGDGTTEDRATPVAVPGLNGVTALAAGDDHTCALANGGVRCWGFNAFGLVGENSADESLAPVDVPGLSGVTAIASGATHTCALQADGMVKCWGAAGLLGSATFDNGPIEVPDLGGVTAIAAGMGHTCALGDDGSVRCWGVNNNGQLGTGEVSDVQITPVAVAGLSGPATVLAAGAYHTCVSVDGGVECWGNNTFGQLGDGTGVTRASPSAVAGLRRSVTAIAGGGLQTCAVLDGGVRCWGLQRDGVLGSGPLPAESHTPVAVVGLDRGVISIAAREAYTCITRIEGGVRCWGAEGSLGLGDDLPAGATLGTPIEVAGLGGARAAVAVGNGHGCALVEGGAVRCWGRNHYGQLGDGTTDSSDAPVEVIGLRGVTALSAGNHHTCALTTEGGVRCWGQNQSGALGTGTDTDNSLPVDVTGLRSGVRAITAG